MKTKLLIYSLPVFLFAMLLYGYSIQDHPTNIEQSSTKEYLQANKDYIPVTPTSAGLCTYTWAPQTSGTTSQLLSVSAVSDKIGWAAGAGPTVRRTSDGGTTWTNATGTGITGSVFNIYAVDDQTAFCTTTPTTTTFIYKTINGGTTWTQVFSLAGGFLNAIQMVSPTEGYAEGDPVGGTWVILKTVNGGDTWTRMATEPAQAGTDAGWNNSFLIIGTHIWFGTNNTRVYHSPDLGATWSFAATTGTLNTFAVHFNDLSNGLAGGNAMVKSVDGGTSYSGTLSPGTTGNIDGLEGNGTDWWALRSNANIYTSADQGATAWTIAHTQAGAVFQDIDFVIEGGCAFGWAVGNGGNIARMKPNEVYTIHVTLTGAQEVPPVITPGTGTLIGTYNEATNVIDFDVVFSGLLSPTNNAHFHAPAIRGVNAPVIIGFVPGFPLGVTSGNYDSSFTLTAGQEAQLLAGLVYVNIHTNLFPGGELRAQLDSIGSNSTLPVELSSFSSNVLKNNVTLNWTTASETNNSGFDIERSIINSHWSRVGNVAGSGTSTTQKNYSFTDRNLNSGNYNYRLKQIDINGNFEYFNLSNEVVIGVPSNFELSQNYPNPFNPSTRIDYQLPNDGNVSISVFDNSGKEIMNLVNEFKTAGYYTVNLNAPSLSSGVYFYKISSDNLSIVKKMMLVK